MRLDKFLSHTGFGSRKEVRLMIKKSYVKVNDNVIKDIGYILNLENDKVTVHDEIVEFEEEVYIMINKPRDYICAHDAVEYPSVLELINNSRSDLFFVGRLDADTEGLLIITNDGQFSHRVAHGKKDIKKQYYVELAHNFDETFVVDLEKGVPMDDSILKPAEVEIIDPQTILLTISEGKYHQVKRMMHYCNNEVSYLKRVRIGELNLDPRLKLGEYRSLTKDEISLFD
ncbi:MAG: pseudouridine synthase [Erysipelothrix sp.]